MKVRATGLGLVGILVGMLLVGCQEAPKPAASDGTSTIPANVQSEMQQKMGGVTGPGNAQRGGAPGTGYIAPPK